MDIKTETSAITAPTSSSAHATPQTLYQRIGGQAVVAALVDRFYLHVVNDPELAPFFNGVSLPKLQHMQIDFFTAALDGPVRYSGRPVHHVHHGLGVQRRHFQSFVEHLFKTLEDFPITEDDRYAIISRLNTYVDDIAASEVPMGG